MKKIDYQALFKTIYEAKNEKEKQKSLEKLHAIVYYFPLKRYKVTTDVAGDFYLFCVNKIPKLLKDYEKYIEKIPFSIFLALRLQFLFHQFLRRRKTPRRAEDDPISWDDILTLHIETQPKSQIKEKVHFLLQKLNMEERLTIKLYYGFYLTLGELRYLTQRQKNIKKTFEYYRMYLQEVEASRKEIEKEKQKLEKYLMDLQKRSQNKSLALDIKNKKLLEILEKMGKIKLKRVASLLGEHQSTTMRRIKKIIKKINGAKVFLK